MASRDGPMERATIAAGRSTTASTSSCPKRWTGPIYPTGRGRGSASAGGGSTSGRTKARDLRVRQKGAPGTRAPWPTSADPRLKRTSWTSRGARATAVPTPKFLATSPTVATTRRTLERSRVPRRHNVSRLRQTRRAPRGGSDSNTSAAVLIDNEEQSPDLDTAETPQGAVRCDWNVPGEFGSGTFEPLDESTRGLSTSVDGAGACHRRAAPGGGQCITPERSSPRRFFDRSGAVALGEARGTTTA